MPGARVTVGTVEVLCLSDATVDYPWLLPELFPGVPDEAWEPFRSRYPAAFGGRQVWRSAYRCFLLRTPAATLLLDTGMGPAGSPLAAVFGMGGRLQDELAAEGVAPEDVDVVVLSHLHPDHVGGSLRDGARLAFPNARYLVNETDWRAFHDPEVQRHFPGSRSWPRPSRRWRRSAPWSSSAVTMPSRTRSPSPRLPGTRPGT